MDIVNLLGSLAGALTTIAFLPQVIKIWKTRSAEDISIGMYLLFITGLALWLAYGIVLGALPVIIANSITLILALMVIVMKLLFRQPEPNYAEE